MSSKMNARKRTREGSDSDIAPGRARCQWGCWSSDDWEHGESSRSGQILFLPSSFRIVTSEETVIESNDVASRIDRT